MNREILFRGRSFSDGGWVFGDLEYERNKGLLGKVRIHTYKEDGGYGRQYLVESDTVGQFTGLTDKNGAKIFEGDIIRVREYKNLLMDEFFDDADRFDLFTLEEIRGELKAEYVSPVAFLEGGFLISSRDDNDFDTFLACLFGDMRRSSPSFEFEVIGNIYDNPELLSTK